MSFMSNGIEGNYKKGEDRVVRKTIAKRHWNSNYPQQDQRTLSHGITYQVGYVACMLTVEI